MASPTHALDLEFASSQFASRADTASLSITGDISILARVKLESLPSATGQNMGIVSKNASGGSLNDGYSFRLRNNGGQVEIAFVFADGSNATERNWTPGTITTGVWYNIAVLVDVSAKTIDFYLDSTLNSGTGSGSAVSISDDGGDTCVGLDRFGANRYFDGLIKDVMIISSYLSEAQVDAIFSGICTFTPDADTKAWWEFNNGYTDSSGNGNTLTPTATPVFSTDLPYTCSVAATPRRTLMGAGT